MALSDRIRQRMQALQLTQNEVAERAGISQGMVYKLVSGKAKRTANLPGLARALECSIEWLGTGKGADDLHANVTEITHIPEDVPLISWVQAGEWAEAEDPYQPGDGEKKLPRIKGGPMTFALRVQGDSMIAPPGATKTFLPGEIIYVDPELRSPNNGQFVVAKVNGRPEVTFKQFKVEDGRPYLHALNPAFQPIFDEFRILGTVIQKLQDV